LIRKPPPLRNMIASSHPLVNWAEKLTLHEL
jgi:hypothetical protein